MKFREVFRYELGHHLRSPATWLYAVFLSGFAFLLITADARGATPINSAGRIAEFTLLLGLMGMLVSAGLFSDASVRDAQSGMDPLLFTTPMSRLDYLGGRFTAALTVNAVILLGIPLGQIAATLMPAYEAGVFLPFRAGVYVQPYLLFLVPNLVVSAAILFTIGMLSRQVIPVYLGAVALFISFIFASVMLESFDNAFIRLIADPVGILAAGRVVDTWTEAERTTRLLGYPPEILLNRLVWIGLAVTLLGVLHQRFRFEHRTGGRGAKPTNVAVAPQTDSSTRVAVPRVDGKTGLRTDVQQVLTIARQSFGEIAASRAFVATLVLGAGMSLLFGWEAGQGVFDTSTWPATVMVVERVLNTIITPVTFLLIAVYAGELVWKARETGQAEIIDATPVSESASLLGRFLGLVAMLALFQAAIMAGGILVQLLQGYYNIEPGVYLRLLFAMNLTDIIILAALAMTIHVVANHKYLAHIIVVVACIAPVAAAEMEYVRHHLLLYGRDPGWTYSDMNGFGPFIAPFAWFKLYWAAWALLLALVGVLFWVRGRESGMRRRLGAARARLAGPVARAMAAAIVLILATGGFIFYNTNVINEYGAADQSGAERARYERTYRRFLGTPQPMITRADLRIDIYPRDRAVDLGGSYRLVNRTAAPIDSIHVLFIDPAIEARSISFDRPSRPMLVDDAAEYRIYRLERPLEPGDSMRILFDVTYRPRGFTNEPLPTEVVANGASFNRSWLPFIGYQPMIELTGDEERAEFGLAPRPPLPAAGDTAALRIREPFLDADLVHVSAIIGTAGDQTAITPGVLQRSWTENGRNYFQYETASPVSFGATVFSAKYEVVEDSWNDVALKIFHHPGHRDNLDRTVRSMKASLAYFSDQFGPYPDKQLRLVETPRYGGLGRSHPHTIAFTEPFFLSRVKDGEIDQPFYGTAHEIAHQWWGGLVQGAPVRGHGLLSESLANYSAMMVMEKTFGPATARRVYDFQMDRYINGRAAQSKEVPLLEVTEQPYIAYRKGAIALYMMRERIGEAAVNTALRRYADRFRDAGPPFATSLDLYAELRAVTPDSLHGLLVDLFETITLWDVETKQAVARPTADGSYLVTLDVTAKKVRADSIGRETEVPMDELVEVGVFGPGGNGGLGKPLYLAHHRIRSGSQTIRITVSGTPARAGIDPYGKLIDRNRSNNTREVGP